MNYQGSGMKTPMKTIDSARTAKNTSDTTARNHMLKSLEFGSRGQPSFKEMRE